MVIVTNRKFSSLYKDVAMDRQLITVIHRLFSFSPRTSLKTHPLNCWFQWFYSEFVDLRLLCGILRSGKGGVIGGIFRSFVIVVVSIKVIVIPNVIRRLLFLKLSSNRLIKGFELSQSITKNHRFLRTLNLSANAFTDNLLRSLSIPKLSISSDSRRL